MSKILVTGSRGSIGSRLVKRLLDDDVIEIDKQMGFDLLTYDLPDVDLVYHLAAQTSVESSWHDPLNDSFNFNMMVRLVQRYPNTKIIYAQSGASLELEVSSPYGFSKKICGDYLKQFHNDWVITVFPNVFGQPKSVVDIFKGKDEVVIYGDGSSIRDYVYIDDIVDGLVKAKDWEKGEYFMGSGKGTTVLELAEGKIVKFMPARKEQKESILPNNTPNWSPKTNVLEYIK